MLRAKLKQLALNLKKCQKSAKNKNNSQFRTRSSQLFTTFATAFRAQMAESVDALVSNTSGVTPVPVRPRLWVLLKKHKVLNLNTIRHLVFISAGTLLNIFKISETDIGGVLRPLYL